MRDPHPPALAGIARRSQGGVELAVRAVAEPVIVASVSRVAVPNILRFEVAPRSGTVFGGG